MRQLHCRVDMFQQMSPSPNSPFRMTRNRYPKKWRSGEWQGKRAWMMSMVSAGISSCKRALASSRVQPLNIRNATRTAAARRIGRLPRVVEARWGFSADPGAAKARPARRWAHEGVPKSVYSLRAGHASTLRQRQARQTFDLAGLFWLRG